MGDFLCVFWYYSALAAMIVSHDPVASKYVNDAIDSVMCLSVSGMHMAHFVATLI